MCGICGKYYFNKDNYVDQRILTKMVQALYKRGPDEEGLFIKDNIGIGVRRLSIVDRDKGSQPMHNEDKTIWLVYNGEIYNYRELKKYLLNKGHVFRSECDGEVIPHLYEEQGISFVQELHGMFALALVDLRKQCLLLVRDRMGIKPLYYGLQNDSVVFASLLTSLIQDPCISLDLDYQGINSYFSYNYFPCHHTPFKGINKLLPGTYALFNAHGCTINSYWRPMLKVDSCGSPMSYVDEFMSIFGRVIKRHLVADVPVGIFLSGGLDSSSIAYFSKNFSQDIAALSIGFREKTYDETRYARLAAKHLQLRHYETAIPNNVIGLIKKMIPAIDIPLGEPSLIPTFALAEFARAHVGVALSGEGTDELFGGYETYKADVLSTIFMNLPHLLKQVILPWIIRRLPYSDDRLNFRFKAGLFLHGIRSPNISPHYSWREIFSADAKKSLYSGDFYEELVATHTVEQPYEIFKEHFFTAYPRHHLEQAMHFDTTVWLPDSILTRVDMINMYHNLEVRVPFLDDEMVDFAYRLPFSEKISNLSGKQIVRRAVNGKLPSAILKRPKQGFSVPIGLWLKHELKQFSREVLTYMPRELDNLLNKSYLLSLFDAHNKEEADYGRQIWSALILILWFNSFTERSN